MRLLHLPVHVFWVPWWDVDHHAYGCPIQISIHTPSWFLSIRPFSSFAQGGDRRGFRYPDVSPWEVVKPRDARRWVLEDEPARIWESVSGHWLDRQYCRNCLEFLADPTRCPEGEYADVARMWTVRYWSARIRHPRQLTAYCTTCLHDENTCERISQHPCITAYRFVFVRHVWKIHVIMRGRCRLRWKDMKEV